MIFVLEKVESNFYSIIVEEQPKYAIILGDKDKF